MNKGVLIEVRDELDKIARLGGVPMYIEHGLEYLGFNRRINFYTRGGLDAWKGSVSFASGYFCKDVLPKQLIFEKLTPIQERYNNETRK